MPVDVVATACGAADTGTMEYQSNEVTIEAATVGAAAHSQHHDDVSMVCFVALVIAAATTTVDVTMEVAACDAYAAGTGIMEYQPSEVAIGAATVGAATQHDVSVDMVAAACDAAEDMVAVACGVAGTGTMEYQPNGVTI